MILSNLMRKWQWFLAFPVSIGFILMLQLLQVPGCEVASNSTKTVSLNGFADSFTMLIASDPQLPWWRNGKDPNCQDDSCVQKKGIETNQAQVFAMNNIKDTESDNGSIKGKWPEVSSLMGGGSVIKQPLGVIMNGDLTAFWHDWQVTLYRKFYDSGYSKPDIGTLNLPIFPGLGNHDYANNVGDCWGKNPFLWLKYGSNTCAMQAVNYIKGIITCNTVSNFNSTLIKKIDSESLAYSWDIGNYHFVQLHNYPTYVNKNIAIKSSISWLKQDLNAATALGQKIVIMLHDFGDHMDKSEPEFLDAIKNQNVVALFAGHIHQDYGYMENIPTINIPFFRSGASEYNKFLLVEFAPEYINVGVIDSEGGTPKFYEPENQKYLNTYFFRN